MNYYSPFNKPIQDVKGKDLVALKTAYEGWYLDYKSDSIEISSFAKSMSAFANHEGGWLFVGVKEEEVPNPEKGKNHKTKLRNAASFPGVDTSRCESVIQDLRTAASNAYLSPRIVFEAFTVHGPVPEIELEDGKSVILVHVPSSANPPHVHKDGCVYRRHLDSCDPVPVTARAELDEMWRRSRESARRLRAFLAPPPNPVAAQDGNVRNAFIYLMHDFSLRSSASRIDLRAFREACTSSMTQSQDPDLKNCYRTQDGFIACETCTDSQALPFAMSLRWWEGGNFRLSVPIRLRPTQPDGPFESNIYLGTLRYRINAHREQHSLPAVNDFVILDFADWSKRLLTLFRAAVTIRQRAEITQPMRVKVLIHGTAGLIPYFPNEGLSRQLSSGGVPRIEDDVISVPPDVDAATFLDVEITEDMPSGGIASDTAIVVIERTLQAVGIDLVRSASTDSESDSLRDFLRYRER